MAATTAGKWGKELDQLKAVTGTMDRGRYTQLLEDNKGDVGRVVGILLDTSSEPAPSPAPAPVPAPAPAGKWDKELAQLKQLFGSIDEVKCVQLLEQNNGDVHHVANKLFDT